jgi:hypothetical protein
VILSRNFRERGWEVLGIGGEMGGSELYICRKERRSKHTDASRMKQRWFWSPILFESALQ